MKPIRKKDAHKEKDAQIEMHIYNDIRKK